MVISLTFAWIGIHEFIFLAFLSAKQAINNNNSNIIGVRQTKERKYVWREVKHILVNFRIFYHSFQLIDFHKILALRKKKFVSAFERRKKGYRKGCSFNSCRFLSAMMWRVAWIISLNFSRIEDKLSAKFSGKISVTINEASLTEFDSAEFLIHCLLLDCLPHVAMISVSRRRRSRINKDCFYVLSQKYFY